MSLLIPRLERFLQRYDVPHQTIHHKRDFGAPFTAHDTHTHGQSFAKVVVLHVDNDFVMAVLPANEWVDMARMREWLNAEQVRLATEEELALLFPDCEVGAEPPLGNLYGLPVFVSPDLSDDGYITFNGGTHETAVRMAMADFVRLVQPAMVEMTG